MAKASTDIRNLLDDLAPPEAADRIRDIVAARIEAIHSSLKIETAGYFNHAHIPDFIARWGTQPAQCREIYLRFNPTDPHLATDIDSLSKGLSDHIPNSPAFCAIKDFDSDQIAPETADVLREHPDVMLTGIDAVAALGASSEQSFERFVSAALLKAGRDIVDNQAIERIAAASQAAIHSALTQDAEGVQAAVTTVEDCLAASTSERIVRYLVALWTAAGGSPESFPGAVRSKHDSVSDQSRRGPEADLSRTEASELLSILLGHDVHMTHLGWRIWSRVVDLDIIESIGATSRSEMLDGLVEALKHDIGAAAVAVRSDYEDDIASLDRPRWTVQGSGLVLEGPHWSMRFYRSARQTRSLKRSHRLRQLDWVMHRLGHFGLQGIKTEFAGLSAEISAADHPEGFEAIISDALSDQWQQNAWTSEATLSGNPSMTVRFDQRTVTCRHGKASLAQLSEVAAAAFLQTTQTR